MIPVFVIIFYLPFSWHYLAACVIFILAAITDGLDGYYARKLGQTSALGAFLDPVADKLMIAVVLVLLVEDQPSIWLALPAAIIIGREITISALREWMAELGASSKVAVSGYGKLKTICQMVALGFLIYHNDLFGIPIYSIGMVLLYIASILTLWSMFLYLQAAWPQLKDS
jgi:CDP-diacylglycerol--glycerol-3-phosphate 3-phosphatidyltransferase/cardiolipin synthase